jgi:hypothetical protein
VSDIVGTAEIAERLGLRQSETVHSWRRRYDDFPEPIAQLSQGFLWSWPDVERWARRTGHPKVLEGRDGIDRST